MKKEKLVYPIKVSIIYAVLLTVFAYLFSKVVQLISETVKTFETSFMHIAVIALFFIVGLMAISTLAQKLAVKLIKAPESKNEDNNPKT
ncbi:MULTISPECIES: hypothetical protein [Acinetobacter]|uniref:Uncharacterized protein n=1 Tax=Acinetobacter schindleri CIP 107287 TaxID=1217988 RepID=N9AB00_9GAMM|nr:hypothetical protein [Acinetobacter schindleri]ENV43319.1 hypothetical protein F955_02866 [Acinetobacter schindleri CIP 107287]